MMRGVRRRAIRAAVVVFTAVSVFGAFAPTPANALSVSAVQVAVNDTVKSVTDLIAAAQAAQTALTTTATSLQAQLQALLPTLQEDPQGAAGAIQGAVNAALPGLESVALNQALALAAKVAAPVCPVVGAAAAQAPLPVPTMPDYSLFGPLAASVKQIDNGNSNGLYNFYVKEFAALLAPVTLPAGAAAYQSYVTLAQTLLSLLAMNYHTVVYPADGGPAIVRDTPGFLNLPMVVDADGNLGVDLCVNTGWDFLGGLTAIKPLNQQIDRVPTADPNMQVDVYGEILLGTFNSGFESKGSHLPSMFETVTGIGLPSLLKPTLNPTTTNVQLPGPTFTQVSGIKGRKVTANTDGTNTVVDTWANLTRLDTTNVSGDYSYSRTDTLSGSTTVGSVYKWTGNGTDWTFKSGIVADTVKYLTKTRRAVCVTATPGCVAAPVRSVVTNATMGVAPATAVEYCTASNGLCANLPAALGALAASETGSSHLTAGVPVNLKTTALLGNTCPGATTLNLTASRFFTGQKIPTSSSPDGHAWIDTDGTAASGCTGSGLNTYPSGFASNDRLATWSGVTSSSVKPPVVAKSGSITCPVGTVIKTGTSSTAVVLSDYLCKFAPSNTTAPSVTGDPYQASILTANPGTWTPSAPNAPSFAYQWLRCDASGGGCTDIANATNTTYTVTASDLGHRLRFRAVGTNLDDSATAESSPTPVITLPPPPANVTPPTISGVLGLGKTLTAATGTWNPTPNSFAYQWLRCDLSGGNCQEIASATDSTYVVALADEAGTLRIKVVGANIFGGTGEATSAQVLIPGQPVNTAPPVVKKKLTAMTGIDLYQGDKLNATGGTWTYSDKPLTYQWFHCLAPNPCSDIGGATGSNYQAALTDLGHTLGVRVTAHNQNEPDATGSTSVESAVTGIVLANAFQLKNTADVVDGVVKASAATANNTTFVGGSFDTVGPLAGGAGAVPSLSTGAGKPMSSAALVRGGVVKATVSDTQGGYFIGGDFTSVRGNPCIGIAHIDKNNVFDPKYCQPAMTWSAGGGGGVRALNYIKRNFTGWFADCSTSVPCAVDELSAGGNFELNGHHNFVMLDSAGSPTYLVSDPDLPINAIADDAGANRFNIFIGGEFTSLGTSPSIPASRLATVTAPQGSAAPSATTPITLTQSNYPGGVSCTSCAGAVVRTVFVNATATTPYIAVGGVFDTAQATRTAGAPPAAVARSNAAMFNEGTVDAQNVAPWSPNPNGEVFAIHAGQGISQPIYLGGDFTQLGATTGFKGFGEWGIGVGLVNNAAGATATGSPNTAYKPQIDNGRILSIQSAGTSGGVYIAGSFTSVMGVTRHRLAHVSTSASSAPTLSVWDPAAGRTVSAISRNATAGTIFAGGDFRVLGGQPRYNIAELSKDSLVTSWAASAISTNVPNAVASVNALVVKGTTLYAGGSFTHAGTTARSNAAAFSTATGVVDGTWNPGPNGVVNVLADSPNADAVLVGGQFSSIGAQPRANLAEVGASGAGAASTWAGDTDGPVNAISVNAARIYVGGAFANVGGSARSNLAAIGGDGVLVVWDPGASGPVHSLVATADGVYVGGAFDTLGGLARNNVGFVDSAGTASATFDPDANGAVRAMKLVNNGSNLFIGGDFTKVFGLDRGHIAQLEADSEGAGTPTENFDSPLDGSVLSLVSFGPSLWLGVFGAFETLLATNPAQYTSGVAVYGG